MGAETQAFAKYNPAYNIDGWSPHDVAVITAPQPLTNVSQDDAVALLKTAPSGVGMWAMGYGLYDIHDYDIDNQGRSGQVTPTYNSANHEYTFSASGNEPWICSGDSGGPLKLVDYDWLAVGIASLTTGGQNGAHCGPTGHWASTQDNYAWLEYAIHSEDCYEDDYVVTCW
jgi:trypsin